jgi:signal transduction histidine kinase
MVDVSEQRAMQRRLAVASRLAAMGTLVAGVAHEINNPLAGALASQELALQDLREVRDVLAGAGPVERTVLAHRLDEVLDAVLDARSGGQRIARVVRDLGTFGRPDPRRQPLRLAEVVEDSLRWMSSSASSSATIEVRIDDAPPVMASAGQLQQVVINLVSNATTSIPVGRPGRVDVRVGTSPDGNAFLEVEDNGAGMTPEVMQRMFDPFFTTSEVGKGLGLGLPVCHAVITAHGGTITARSTPGAGSRFRVELPPLAG